MSFAPTLRRAAAELDATAAETGCAGIGNRSIHQFWHLFGSHFRGVLLAPRRRADSGNVAWVWQEVAAGPVPTASELGELRLRLANASRSFAAAGADDGEPGSLEAQVQSRVERMTAALMGKPDAALAGYACRTESGLMLHSWGAATPVQPSHPDEQQGEISGRVLADGAPVAGASVVLENSSGLGVARTKSSPDGGFHIQGAGPGHYRLRVADRADFPADGLPIQLERAALAGLELRGGSARPVSANRAEQPVAKPRRWPRRVLPGILVWVAAGAGLWHYVRPTVTRTADERPDSGWQSARGNLAVSTDADPAPDGPRLAGGAGWSELSRTLPAPREPKIHSSGSRAVAGESAEPRDAGARSGMGDGRRRTEPSSAATAESPSRPVHPESGREDQASTGSHAGESRHDTSNSENHPGSDPADAAPAPPDSTEMEPGPSASGKKRRAIMGSSQATVDTADSEDRSGGATLRAAGGMAAKVSIATDTAVPGVAAGKRGGMASTSAVTGGGAMAAAGLQSSPGSGPNAESSGHVTASLGVPRHERTGGANGNGTEVALTAKDAGQETKSAPAAVQAGPAVDKGEVETRLPANAKISPTKTEATMAAKVAPAGHAAMADEAQKTPSPPAVTMAASPGVRPPEAIATGTGRSSGDAGSNHPGLVQRGRIRASAWKARLVRDATVPTVPVAAGQRETLTETRDSIVSRQRENMPRTFRAAATRSGFALEFAPAAGGESDRPRWRDASGAEPASATVQENRAELDWAGPVPLRGQEYHLGYADGRELAQISAGPDGAPVLKTEKNVHGWYWVGVERASADDTGPANGDSRFEWKLLSGEAVPLAWRCDDHWRGDRGQRIVIPLESTGAAASYALALVDRVSGWAMTCEIGVR